MSGVGDGLFDPEGTSSRGQIATTLYRLEGEPEVTGTVSFSDVAPGSYYEKGIAWAESVGIVQGHGDGTFGPEDPINREQMATILYHYAQYKGLGFTGDWMFPLGYADSADVSDWAYEAVCWFTMKEIIEGKDGNLFDPEGTAIRAESACLIQRFCETILKK